MLVPMALEAMATRFELVVCGAREPMLRRAGARALEEVEIADRQLSRFRRDSVVAFLEREAMLRPVRVLPEIFELLLLCKEAHRQSGGAFDISIGARMEELGFHETVNREADEQCMKDSPQSRRGARTRRESNRPGEARGLEALELREESCEVVLHGRIKLDLGGVGKGYAIDRAVEVLREEGVRSAFLHGGTSSVFALGAPPGQAAWKVGLRNPSGADVEICLEDRALSVSSTHGRRRWIDGELKSHVIDPRDGSPLGGECVAAVVHPTAARAEVWSTALLVLGPDFVVPDPQATSLYLSAQSRMALHGAEQRLFRTRQAPFAGAITGK